VCGCVCVWCLCVYVCVVFMSVCGVCSVCVYVCFVWRVSGVCVRGFVC